MGTIDELDTNKDGRISETEAAAAEGDDDLLGSLGLPPLDATLSSKGSPLWPYEVGADTVTGLEVENRATSRFFPGASKKVGARYYEADTLEPLRWSPEQRAQMQRSLWQIGLYGDKKVRLGSWSSDDQKAFAMLLTQANVDGREWFEQLAEWKRRPPTELLSTLAGEGKAKPTLQVSNPIDIRTAAEKVSEGLIGRRDRTFVEGAVPALQAQEIGAQRAEIAEAEAGGGGTITAAPGGEAFLADKLRREKPVEVDGYAFLGGFETFLDMIGGR